MADGVNLCSESSIQNLLLQTLHNRKKKLFQGRKIATGQLELQLSHFLSPWDAKKYIW